MAISFIPVCGWGVAAKAETLVVGLSEQDYPPFYYEEAGEFRGPAIEILESIADELGYTPQYKRYPWARVQWYLETADIDMVSLYLYSQDRAEHVVYTDTPHIFERSAIIVAADSDTAITNKIDSLDGYKVGVVRGYWHGEDFDEARESLDIEEVTEEEQLLNMLVAGRIDAIVGIDATILDYAADLGLRDRIDVLEPGIDVSEDYLAFSRGLDNADQLAAEFSDAMAEYIRSDEYFELMEQYNMHLPESAHERRAEVGSTD